MAQRALIVASLLPLLAFLGGCDTIPQTQPVNVAIPVKCLAAEPQRPAMPTESLIVGDSLDTKTRALIAEIELREGYEDELRTALRACK